jgi:hypothetical protein
MACSSPRIVSCIARNPFPADLAACLDMERHARRVRSPRRPAAKALEHRAVQSLENMVTSPT